MSNTLKYRSIYEYNGRMATRTTDVFQMGLTHSDMWNWLRSRYTQISSLDPYNKMSYEEFSAKLDSLANEHTEHFFNTFVEKD